MVLAWYEVPQHPLPHFPRHLVEEYKDFGGIRIEDDVLVTGDGHRILGKPIPKTIEEVEKACSN